MDEQTTHKPLERDTVDFEKPDSLVGQRLGGRFLIEKNLTDGDGDAGGIGVVYLATDTKLMGKEVVVKILQESALKHADIVRKFQHEKEALIRLDHPGIVRILDSGTLSDGNPFMVMDFVKGHSLRKALQAAGRMPVDVAASIIEAVTDALTAAHSAKILHRDIKPENIMLTPLDEGLYRVRLIDFGIARVGESKLAPATEIQRAIGTVLYIAPEQLIGAPDLSPAADIYATAIVAYEMLTGETPFKPRAIAEMYQLQRDGVKTLPRALRPEMPRMAESILMSALEFDSEKRPQIARAWGRYLANELVKDSEKATDRFFASVQTEFSRSPTVAISMPETDENLTVERRKPTASPISKGDKLFRLAVAGVIALAVLAIPAIYFVWAALAPKTTVDQPAANTVADTILERQLTYFLKVQKMRDGKPFEEPFKSSGQEVYESGYRFSLNFVPNTDGFIYIYNEGKDDIGHTGYYLIFPTLNINGNSSKVSAGQQIETAQNGFGGGRGTEIMWLVWSKQKRDDLEAIWQSVPDKRNPVSDPTQVELLTSQQKAYNSSKPLSSKDTASQSTIVRSTDDLIVHRFELEHR